MPGVVQFLVAAGGYMQKSHFSFIAKKESKGLFPYRIITLHLLPDACPWLCSILKSHELTKHGGLTESTCAIALQR